MELLLAMGLAAAVLAALLSAWSMLVRSHTDAAVKAEVSAWSVAGLDQLNRDARAATYIQTPAAGTSSQVLAGCGNFSKAMFDSLGQGRLDPDAEVTAFYYCRSDDAGGGRPGLLRYERRSAALVCPADIPVSDPCGAAVAGAARSVVIRDFHHRDDDALQSPPLFRSRADGVRMAFSVGLATAPAPGSGRPDLPVPPHLKQEVFLRVNRAAGAD
ncbi:MAG: hypothetical protein HY924_07315 [Elusimicrobia bacterium]|nr:hypothetical protein [Elusimicrobiota bacterium]